MNSKDIKILNNVSGLGESMFFSKQTVPIPTKSNPCTYESSHSSKSEISLKLPTVFFSPPQIAFYALSVTMAVAGVNRDLKAIKVKDTDQHQQPPSIGPDNESGRAAS